MKIYLLPLAICFAVINVSFARVDQEKELACLFDNGLNNTTDVEFFHDFIRNDDYKKEFYLERQFTCAISCVVNIIRDPQQDIYQLLTEIIEYDYLIQGDLKRDMKYQLENCHQQDEGDDCKLLYCIRILRSPFKKALSSLVSSFHQESPE